MQETELNDSKISIPAPLVHSLRAERNTAQPVLQCDHSMFAD